MLKRSKSHFSASLAYPEGYNSPSISLKAQGELRELRKSQMKQIREMGWKEKYFQFIDGDKAAKARAKAQAERVAAQWAEKTGFRFSVHEGFFMSF